jgi:hypothetical protein
MRRETFALRSFVPKKQMKGDLTDGLKADVEACHGHLREVPGHQVLARNARRKISPPARL